MKENTKILVAQRRVRTAAFSGRFSLSGDEEVRDIAFAIHPEVRDIAFAIHPEVRDIAFAILPEVRDIAFAILQEVQRVSAAGRSSTGLRSLLDL
jgi:hypothetical protein